MTSRARVRRRWRATCARALRCSSCTLTGGERGDILNPAMERPEVRADFAAVRREEMARAREILGRGAALPRLHRLRAARGRPEAAAARRAASRWSRVAEAAAPLVRAVREFRPHVILTYDESGGYPHPDHIKTHEVSVAAFEAAGRPGPLPGPRRAVAAAQAVLLLDLPPGEVRRAARGDAAPRPGVAVYEDLRGMGGAGPQARRGRLARPSTSPPASGAATTSRSGTRRCSRTPPRSRPTVPGSPARWTSSAPPGRPRTIILLGRWWTPNCRKTTSSTASGRV